MPKDRLADLRKVGVRLVQNAPIVGSNESLFWLESRGWISSNDRKAVGYVLWFRQDVRWRPVTVIGCDCPVISLVEVFSCDMYDTIRYDTIGEFNVDWKAEYSALSSTRSQKKKLKQPD